MLKHRLVEGVKGEVTVGISVLEGGHWRVQNVGLVAERWVVHRDDFERVLVMENAIRCQAEDIRTVYTVIIFLNLYGKYYTKNYTEKSPSYQLSQALQNVGRK